MTLPKQVKIVEVGPRDGLQNESKRLDTSIKIQLIDRLSETGLAVIESGSFVSPKWLPQLADAADVFQGINKFKGITYPFLTPNMKGLERAIAAGVSEVAVFVAASETFSKKNINTDIANSLKQAELVIGQAKSNGMKVRAYISCVLGCPYEGDVSMDKVASIAQHLSKYGCYEISLGDTIGVGSPLNVQTLLEKVTQVVPRLQLAVHFHDTYGQALVNVFAALQYGITTIDSAISGLGGCPYAKGASGNLATEDLLYLLNNLKINTSVNLDKLIDVSWFIANALGKKPLSRVSLAKAR